MKFSEITDGLLVGKAYQRGTQFKYSFIALAFGDEGKPNEFGEITEYTIIPAFAKYGATTFSFCRRLITTSDLLHDWHEVDLNVLIAKAKKEFYQEEQ